MELSEEIQTTVTYLPWKMKLTYPKEALQVTADDIAIEVFPNLWTILQILVKLPLTAASEKKFFKT